jgi:hypothetical protein
MRRFVAFALAFLFLAATPGCIIVSGSKGHDHHCKKCAKQCEWCEKCGRNVGDDHKCGKTQWCEDCKCEVGKDHHCDS